MPFQSEAQKRWMFKNNPAMARRWAKYTKSKDLPERKGSDADAKVEKKKGTKDGDE